MAPRLLKARGAFWWCFRAGLPAVFRVRLFVGLFPPFQSDKRTNTVCCSLPHPSGSPAPRPYPAVANLLVFFAKKHLQKLTFCQKTSFCWPKKPFQANKFATRKKQRAGRHESAFSPANAIQTHFPKMSLPMRPVTP